MKDKTPYLDLPGLLTTNTCIFKQNLKMITMSVIDEIWMDKTRTDNISDTIKTAFFEIYKGGFDEIQELDEEQLYNSYMNSGVNTDRVITENNSDGFQKNVSSKKQSPKNNNLVVPGEDSYYQQRGSDLYDKEAITKLTNEISPVVNLQNNDFTKFSIENIIDHDNDEKQLFKFKPISLKIQEYKNHRLSEQNMQRNDSGKKKTSQKLQNHITMSPDKFKLDENNFNLTNRSDYRSHDNRIDFQGRNFYSSTDSNFVTGGNASSRKLKNITKNYSLKPQKLISLQNRYHTLSKDKNRQLIVSNEDQINPHVNTSFKHDDFVRGHRTELTHLSSHKLFKKPKHDIGIKSASKINTRNRSYITIKDRPNFGDGGAFKHNLRTLSHRRLITEHRGNSFNFRDLTHKTRI